MKGDIRAFSGVGGVRYRVPMNAHVRLDAGYKFGRFVGDTNLNTSLFCFGVGAKF
jgi:hypothetical protein